MTVNQLLKKLIEKTCAGEVRWVPLYESPSQSITTVGRYIIKFTYCVENQWHPALARLDVKEAGQRLGASISTEWSSCQPGIGYAKRLYLAIIDHALSTVPPTQAEALAELEAALSAAGEVHDEPSV